MNVFIQDFDTVVVRTQRHLMLFGVSTLFSIAIGLSVAIFSTWEGRERIGKVLLNATAMSQAVPSVAVIALVFLFVGIGVTPTLIALVLYSLVPIVFNAVSGLLSVDGKND